MTQLVIALDIGGTYSRIGVYDSQKLVFFHQCATKRGVLGLSEVILSLLEACPFPIQSLSIGIPGTILNGSLLPGSARNIESYPDELSNFNLSSLLPNNIDAIFYNDAYVQLFGSVEWYRSCHSFLDDMSFCFLGLGTGLGCAQVTYHKGTVLSSEMVSLAHLEDLLSGSAFHHLCDELSAESALDIMADALIKLVAKLGSFHYLIGGGFGMSQLGRILLDRVELLSDLPFGFYQIPSDVHPGLLGHTVL